MPTVVSKDGTRIAYDRAGTGPAIVLVNGALQSRRSHAKLAEILSAGLTVLSYDRRGRGDSGDTAPYAVQREIEDIDTLIAAAGGAAALYGTSSGATLALKAAASGSKASALVLWEPIFMVDQSRPGLPAEYLAHLRDLVATGRRGDAVEYFLTVGALVPPQFVLPMRGSPVWPALEAVAHTLPYDATIVDDTMSGKPVAPEQWAGVRVPALVADGGTTPWISAAADAVAGALPQGSRRTLQGQSHDVAAEAIAGAITSFLSGRS